MHEHLEIGQAEQIKVQADTKFSKDFSEIDKKIQEGEDFYKAKAYERALVCYKEALALASNPNKQSPIMLYYQYIATYNIIFTKVDDESDTLKKLNEFEAEIQALCKSLTKIKNTLKFLDKQKTDIKLSIEHFREILEKNKDVFRAVGQAMSVAFWNAQYKEKISVIENAAAIKKSAHYLKIKHVYHPVSKDKDKNYYKLCADQLGSLSDFFVDKEACHHLAIEYLKDALWCLDEMTPSFSEKYNILLALLYALEKNNDFTEMQKVIDKYRIVNNLSKLEVSALSKYEMLTYCFTAGKAANVDIQTLRYLAQKINICYKQLTQEERGKDWIAAAYTAIQDYVPKPNASTLFCKKGSAVVRVHIVNVCPDLILNHQGPRSR